MIIGVDVHQRLFKDEFYRSSSTGTNPYADRSHLTNTTFGSGKDREVTAHSHYHHTKDSIDNGIYMQKEWHVEAGEPSDASRQV